MYDKILYYGDVISTNLYKNPNLILKDIDKFSSDWKPYNPRKNPGREGLSITSLDGGLSGVPDLDSVKEYCVKNNVELDEMDFSIPTPVYSVVSNYTELFKNDLGRSHFIRHKPGGFFPPHRDLGKDLTDIQSFRLFVPIQNCNPPQTWFMLDRKPLNFEHGRAYFINTCIEHTVFSCYEAIFIVFNIALNKNTVNTLLQNMQWR
tara:strand:- start:153 stop:767 length:615 start_codon:yes stop_codon:yes gene_type:complete